MEEEESLQVYLLFVEQETKFRAPAHIVASSPQEAMQIAEEYKRDIVQQAVKLDCSTTHTILEPITSWDVPNG